MAEDNSLGRKVFFLYPSAVIQNQIVAELAQEEFEVYIIKDEKKLKKALKTYPNSIVFANLNDGMKESEWEEWIRSVMGNQETEGVSIGILTYGAGDEALKQKYVEHFKVKCGYTVIKSDIPAAISTLVAILNSVNAKGRRKYIRALTGSETNVTVNLPVNGTFINGHIKDVSVVGFSCYFDEDPALAKNTLFNDIQIRLQSQLIKAECIVFGSRMDTGQKTYVLLFTPRTDQTVKSKIRNYIQSYLQGKMDSELK